MSYCFNYCKFVKINIVKSGSIMPSTFFPHWSLFLLLLLFTKQTPTYFPQHLPYAQYEGVLPTSFHFIALSLQPQKKKWPIQGPTGSWHFQPGENWHHSILCSTGNFNISFPCGSNPKPLDDIRDMSILSSEAGQYWFTTGLSKWHPTPVFLPGEFHGKRTWQAVVHGVKKSQTRLSDFHFTCYQFTSS